MVWSVLFDGIEWYDIGVWIENRLFGETDWWIQCRKRGLEIILYLATVAKWETEQTAFYLEYQCQSIRTERWNNASKAESEWSIENNWREGMARMEGISEPERRIGRRTLETRKRSRK